MSTTPLPPTLLATPDQSKSTQCNNHNQTIKHQNRLLIGFLHRGPGFVIPRRRDGAARRPLRRAPPVRLFASPPPPHPLFCSLCQDACLAGPACLCCCPPRSIQYKQYESPPNQPSKSTQLGTPSKHQINATQHTNQIINTPNLNQHNNQCNQCNAINQTASSALTSASWSKTLASCRSCR